MSEDLQKATSPNFFNMLSESDKHGYTELRNNLTAPSTRNQRGKRLETFAEALDTIKSFAVRHDADDWKRCLVCGVCWLDNCLAINIRQLSILVNKCKSSVNASLHKMGYATAPARTDSSNLLVEQIPLLKGNFQELRQWTIRQMGAITPQPEIPRYTYTPQMTNSIPTTPQQWNPLLRHPLPVIPSIAPSISQPSFANINDNSNDYQSMYDFDNSDTDVFCLPLNNWDPNENSQNQFDDM